MTVKLNERGFQHAKDLIKKGHVVIDNRDAWSEHQASTEQENEFIRVHGFGGYGRWHLAVDDTKPEDTKGHYKFPYGDFKNIHRCAVISAESRAAQNKYHDVELAAAHLHGMLEK